MLHCIANLMSLLLIVGNEGFLIVIKKKLEYFQYHVKCQDIPDNIGDIELVPSKRCQSTMHASLY